MRFLPVEHTIELDVFELGASLSMRRRQDDRRQRHVGPHQLERQRSVERQVGDRSVPPPRYLDRGSIAKDHAQVTIVSIDRRDHRREDGRFVRRRGLDEGFRGALRVMRRDACRKTPFEWHRLSPRGGPGEAYQIEDVQKISVDVEIAEVILADEIDEWRRLAADWRRLLEGGTFRRRPRGVEIVIDDRASARRRNLEPERALIDGRRQPMPHGIVIGPVHERDIRRRRLGARHRVGRDDDRHAVEAGVVENRRIEDRTRVVRAAVQVRADLQRAVPKLKAAAHAGWQNRAGQPIVPDDPRRERHGGRDQQHTRVCHTVTRVWNVRARADGAPTREHDKRREQQRYENEIRPELRRQTGQSAGEDVQPPAITRSGADERHERRHEDHGAQCIGRLRRRIDRVERENPGQHRGQHGGAPVDPRQREAVDEQRQRGIQCRLDDERNPRPISEEPIEEGEKVRIAPRIFHSRERPPGCHFERKRVVVIESFPPIRVRRPYEDKEQPKRERDAARRVHSRLAAEHAVDRRFHLKASYR